MSPRGRHSGGSPRTHDAGSKRGGKGTIRACHLRRASVRTHVRTDGVQRGRRGAEDIRQTAARLQRAVRSPRNRSRHASAPQSTRTRLKRPVYRGMRLDGQPHRGAAPHGELAQHGQQQPDAPSAHPDVAMPKQLTWRTQAPQSGPTRAGAGSARHAHRLPRSARREALHCRRRATRA